MAGLNWLFFANILVWLGLGGYLAMLAHIQKKQIRRMEMLCMNNDGGSHASL